MSKQYIAQVPTAVVVDGKRKVIQPGQALPDLPEKDTHELLQSNAAIAAEADPKPTTAPITTEAESAQSPKKKGRRQS